VKTLYVASGQAGADRGERLGVAHLAEAVVELLERDSLALGLALGPLVPVELDPDGEGRVGGGLDERRAPVRVEQVDVVVVDEHVWRPNSKCGWPSEPPWRQPRQAIVFSCATPIMTTPPRDARLARSK
jgi:hypothetical protein